MLYVVNSTSGLGNSMHGAIMPREMCINVLILWV